MSKHERLTEAEMATFGLQRRVRRALEAYVRETGKRPGDIRVLDWGCGRGRSVAWLRKRDYEAFGVDIDPQVIANGRPLFAQRGLDAESILMPLHEVDRLAPESFDFVFSEQVFEHVADIKQCVRSIARLTRPGGIGLHVFPGRLNFQEGHLFMPFIHWLPKSGLRRKALSLYLRCGFGPAVNESSWPEAHGKSHRERVEVFYRYSVERTFYRRAVDVVQEFSAVGLSPTFPVALRSWQRLLPVRSWALDGLYKGSTVIHTQKH